MVRVQVGVEPGGLATGGDLPNQAGMGQRSQAVIHRGPRRARIVAVHRPKNLFGSGMDGMPGKKFEDRVALRSGPQTSGFESRGKAGTKARHSMILYYV